MKIVANTDVLLREQRHDKGTVFDVVGEITEASAPTDVDADTAARWRRMEWAENVAETSEARATPQRSA